MKDETPCKLNFKQVNMALNGLYKSTYSTCIYFDNQDYGEKDKGRMNGQGFGKVTLVAIFLWAIFSMTISMPIF